MASDSFGISVSLDGDRLAIGATGVDDADDRAGATYIFERDAGSGRWSQEAKLTASDGGLLDFFGAAVSLEGDRLLIGAWCVQDDPGAAYVFERQDDGELTEQAKLTASDGEGIDNNFGQDVGLDGDRILVGAERDPEFIGSAYQFDRAIDGSWVETAKITPFDTAPFDLFGTSVAIEADRVVVGASQDDDFGTSSGSVSLFETVVVSPLLALAGTCPGEIALRSVDFTPRDGIALYGGAEPGASVVDDGPCAGTILEIDSPTLLREGDTDFRGRAQLIRNLRRRWCGSLFQALDLRTCLTTGLIEVPLSGPPEAGKRETR